MKLKKILAVGIAAILLTGCGVSSKGNNPELTDEEREWQAVRQWFTMSIADEEDFPDKKDYQYYAKTLGLEKDAFLSADMWEVFRSAEINLNYDIDEQSIYLIRLNPEKLLEIYAENNECTVDEICSRLSLTYEQLYYNWGYTATNVNYTQKHKDGLVSYSDEEKKIFGADNGENRQIVMSTHMLIVDDSGTNVTYNSTPNILEIRQRDLLNISTKINCNYSSYTEEEKNPAFKVNSIGIRRVLPLSLPNGWEEAEETDKGITIMFNASPFSYGCKDEDKLMAVIEDEVTEISETETEAEMETGTETGITEKAVSETESEVNE